MNRNNEFYSTQADIYTLIADDRDFCGEVTQMGIFQLGRTATFVELFAGPAYHSRALTDMGWGGNTIAIDRSSKMKKIACELQFKGEYICADVLDGLSQVREADVVCVSRYSILLIDSLYLQNLFNSVSRILKKGGLFFIEMLKTAIVNGNNPHEYQWDNLGIYQRQAKISGANIVCIWPFATEIVDPVNNIIDATIKVSTIKDCGNCEENFFISREHLHSISELDSCANKAGLMRIRKQDFTTADGLYIAYSCIGDSINSDVTTEASNEYIKTLTDQAFTRVFNLQTKESRDALIQKSGLDVDLHDSPLSRHVYTIL